MIQKQKLIVSIPYIIVLAILLYTWTKILTIDYFATLKHEIGLGACLLNLLLYFFRYKYAVIFTGVILVLATFNQLALFPDIESASFFIKIAGKELSTPNIQWKSMLILILYLILVFSFRLTVWNKGRQRIQ